METITTTHPLRTITLRSDGSITAPAFETLALQYYHEIHDRTWEMLQRIQRGRRLVPGFRFQIEGIERLYDLATYKFDRLKRMVASNPLRDTVYQQLNELLADMNNAVNELLPNLIDETKVFIDHEDYSFEQDQWMEEIAFPQFDKIFANYEECSIDMVFFDLDLEDFKHALAFAKKQEGLYLDEMNTLIDDYSDLNYRVDHFMGQVDEFDRELLGGA